MFEPLDFDIDENFETDDLVDTMELEGENISKPSEYLSAEQKDGTILKQIKFSKKHGFGLKNENVRAL